MFNYHLNTGCKNQLVYRGDAEVVRIPPFCAVDELGINYNVAELKPIKSFIDVMGEKGVERFYIKRSFAFGDVLMVVPVVRYLRTLGYDPYLVTRKKYLDVLKLLEIEMTAVQGLELQGGLDDYGIQLDGTVERDHYQELFQRFHRVEIYLKALGVRKLPEKVDWSCDLSKFPTINCWKRNYIVFQGQGSTNTKSLPEESIRELLKKLNKDGVGVVYIGNRISTEGIDERKTEFKFCDLTLSELFSLIAGARCLVCMDSAPFWISHFVKTPAVVVFGSVDGKLRTKFHPLSPDGVMPIQLDREIGCKHCFENAVKCNFRFDCLKVSPERIYNLMQPHVLRYWEAG